ncbi:MAG: UDP-N-acetylmuramate dehydrogenase [Clostridia bacterium]
MNKKFLFELKEVCRVTSFVDLKTLTTFRIGGKAEYYAEVSSVAGLKKALKICEKHNVKYSIIGRGSNILASDNGFLGLIIRLCGDFCGVSKSLNKVICGAGVNLILLNHFLAEQSLGGLEWSYGIPGSVGGAIYMNAGAYCHEMSEFVDFVVVLRGGKVLFVGKKEMSFSYRFSSFQNKTDVILFVGFGLKPNKKEKILRTQKAIITKRAASQPINCPSAGSVFKRKDGIVPAKIIDEIGLKGKKIGCACVSKMHAGFIVNCGLATCQDVINLISYVKKEVFDKRQIVLEEEIEFLGE